ncbi:MAG: hypothetical protein O3C27_06560 [Actinomycetota bacterium]|nr:hypothetical protein [Actinomycetota bacterium]
MLKPSPAELLVGVADALDETVFPSLDRGLARNQVQAAIGIIRRCAAAIDALGPMLHAECTDLAATLRGIATADPDLVSDRPAFELVADRAVDVLGSTYPPISELIEVVTLLRGQAAALSVAAERRASSQRPEVGRLLQRMLEREESLGLSPW